ncbi:MAG TPA: hypothetical protein VH333_24585 [Pseudonocardiaceae bacterium]|jgi:hypothetical protein|nr:hypothetical protein [Pseudonocardiaceae bacterium]
MSCQFADEIIKLHGNLSYRGLPDAIEGEPVFRFDGPDDGLTTIGVRQSQLPMRYLRAVMGFRLAKFLEIGFMDPELVRRRALFYEPLAHVAGPETIHTVTLTSTGRIGGYMALVGTPDPVPLSFDDPTRTRFPAEVAHRVDLLRGFAGPGLNTHQVYEIKRLVRDPAATSGQQRERVPWHLILALGMAARAVGVSHVLGDAREAGALRHLRAIGFTPLVINDTRPSLPRTELMWPSYTMPEPAKPFVGEIPAELDTSLDIIRTALEQRTGTEWQRGLIRQLVAARTGARRDRELVSAGAGLGAGTGY